MIGKLILILVVVVILTSITYISVDVGTDKDFQPNFRCERINSTVSCGWLLNETGGDDNASDNG